MRACWCVLAGTKACENCSNNTFTIVPTTTIARKTFTTYISESSNDKRFTVEDGLQKVKLIDNKYNCFYFIEDTLENVQLLCDRLNMLKE